MTASQQCKAAGLKSLSHLSRLVEVPRNTLDKWCDSRPKLFAAIVAGAAAMEACRE